MDEEYDDYDDEDDEYEGRSGKKKRPSHGGFIIDEAGNVILSIFFFMF